MTAAPRRAAGARFDPEWLQGEYNLRDRHPEHGDIFARWRTASAAVRRDERCEHDLRYGAGLGETIDVYPTAQANAPVLVFIHGGYWRSLDKGDHAFLAPSFTRAGALVMMPNYALCPGVGIEHIALQMTRALDWAYRNAALHGGDPGRIVVAGHSAGGHLATMMLSCRWRDVAPDLPLQLVSGALAISGLFDLEPLRHAPFLQADLRLTPASVNRLSPAFFPRPKRPLLVAVGGDETAEFQRQSMLIRDQWGPTSVPACETLAGLNHFTIVDGLGQAGAPLHEMAWRLLGADRRLKGD